VRRSARPGATCRTGWVRSNAWIWLFSSTHTTIACSGGSRYNPTTSRTLASNSGSVENLNVSVCHGLTSCSAHTLATVLWLTPSSVASSREDQWVTPSAWGGRLRVVARISARRARRTVWGRPRRCRSASPLVSPSRA
jgi:hypothetical protein